MVHLPKLALPHGHAIFFPARTIPLWFPVALALLSLAAAAVATQVVLGRSLTFDSSARGLGGLEAVVLRYVNEWSESSDPLVTLTDGRQAKYSNVYGIDVGGTRYFYQLTRQDSFDPLRRGALRDYETVAVLDAGTMWEVLIY